MDAETLEEEWDIITDFLPEKWEELAWHTDALQRSRKIKEPNTLLQLIMLHAAGGLSLKQATARAERLDIASISDVALMNRLKKSEEWLRALTIKTLQERDIEYSTMADVGNKQIRVIDASTVEEPGSTGTDWRVHYALQLPSLECDFIEITDQTGGETYKRVPVTEGDIILGDRGYCHREGVAHVLNEGGDVLVRLTWNTFPLEDRSGNEFDIVEHLRNLEGHEPGEWDVQFTANGETYDGRLCAVRRSKKAAQKAKNRIHSDSPCEETIEAAEYSFILTTLSKEAVSTEEALDLYRARWQVELAFKRVKTLFGAGHVPKYDEQSAKAWLYAKFLAVLLIERLIEAADFFPCGYDLRTA